MEIVPGLADTRVEVGNFGSYDGGRFDRHGNLADRLTFAVEKADAAPFTFASQGKVSIGPSVMVTGGAPGGRLLKADVTFSGSRAVVASFAAGTTYSVPDRDLSKAVGKLWHSKGLLPHLVVVWLVRTPPAAPC